MLRLFMVGFIFLAILVVGVLLAIGVIVARVQKKADAPRVDPYVIDVEAIDVDEDQAAEITSTDLLLKP